MTALGIIKQNIFPGFSIYTKICDPFSLIAIASISRRPTITRKTFEVIGRCGNCQNENSA